MIRREAIVWLLKMSGVTSTAVILAACKKEEEAAGRPAPDIPTKSAPKADYGFFQPSEVAIGTAMVARLIPAAPGFPSAKETGALRFIDRELQKRHFAPVAKFVRQGLTFLDRVAKKEKKKAFTELSVADQDEVLRAFQTGRVRGLRYPSGRFFQIMLNLTLEGHLGDPKYGGNQDQKAWKALGIDPSCDHGDHSHG
ncbi:MAG: gluconate 2-dehydrogenase subunit 3 family protein [Myxococcota bacterium]